MVRVNYKSTLVILILLCTMLVINKLSKQRTQKSSHNFRIIERQNSNQLRVLLWNTDFYSNGYLTKNNSLCYRSNCGFSDDRQNLSSYDAIIFLWPHINKNDLPSKGNDNQKWVLYNKESPHHTNIGADTLGLAKIDLIMNYRTDSDIHITYGSAFKCKTKWKPKHKFADKTKSIVWMVSHCKTPSNREGYVHKLARYIDIDMYGSCSQKKCPRSQEKACNEMISKDYKFYLSFENSICRDYITEKAFNYMRLDLIPIVMGGANYTSLLPPNSYIDVMNFSSPRLLAEYLKVVANNESLFNAYFEWKNNYCIENTSLKTNLCKLCQYIRTDTKKRVISSKKELSKWWVNGSNCSSIVFDKENINLVPNLFSPIG